MTMRIPSCTTVRTIAEDGTEEWRGTLLDLMETNPDDDELRDLINPGCDFVAIGGGAAPLLTVQIIDAPEVL